MSPWALLALLTLILALAAPLGRYAPAPLVDVWNALSFALRRRLPWPARTPPWPQEDKRMLFAHVATTEQEALAHQERTLRQRYRLDVARRDYSTLVYAENLYWLTMLEMAFANLSLGRLRRVVDIGSQDFRYALALCRYVETRAGADAQIEGIELDGYRLLARGYRRLDHGHLYARTAGPKVHYLCADALAVEFEAIDLVTVFFPFLMPNALTTWGLPKRYFAPLALIRHLGKMLRPGGHALLATHTTVENTVLQQLLDHDTTLVRCRQVAADTTLVPYAAATAERRITVVSRVANAS